MRLSSALNLGEIGLESRGVDLGGQALDLVLVLLDVELGGEGLELRLSGCEVHLLKSIFKFFDGLLDLVVGDEGCNAAG